MATLAVQNEFNVYESADARFEAAARKLGLEEGLYRFLKYPQQGNHRLYSGERSITATWKCSSVTACIIPSFAARAREAFDSLRM